jgi:putative ABC transport system permease protein
MLGNYLRLAWRNIKRNPGFSAINILGLAAGLACFLLIGTYIWFERGYDGFQAKADRIFRVTSEGLSSGESYTFAQTPTAAGPTIKREFPEVVSSVRIFSTADFSPTVIKHAEEVYQEKAFLWADSTFFEVFSFPLLSGDPKRVLDEVNSVVLTQSAAQRYFGEANPVGQILKVGQNRDMLVTGVAADAPNNSQIKFEFVASFHSLENWREHIWDSANFFTYLELTQAEAAPGLEAKIKSGMPRFTGEAMTASSYLTYVLQPLRDVHLRARVEGGLEPGSDIRYLYIFSVIAVLILLIACINYINLTTARSIERARESGVRKVVGAYQGQLFWQFFAESAFVTGIAMVLGTLAAYLFMPGFRQLTDRPLVFFFLDNPLAMTALVALGLIVSLLAGGYPALIMSKFEPVRVLKGNFKSTGSGGRLRRGLVVFQFAVSFLLMVGALVIGRQLDFIKQRKLGYDKTQVLELPIDRSIRQNIGAFKRELLADPNIKSIALATENPVFVQGGYSMWAEGRPEDFLLGVGAVGADPDYVKTLGMRLVAGEDFNESDVALVAMDSAEFRQYHFILNETAAKALGWTPQTAIGKRARINSRVGKIKGVVEDFHFASMRDAIRPFAMFITARELNKMIIKLGTSDLPGTLASLKTAWRNRAPHRPFEYQFLDEQFDELYRAETRSGRIASVFALLAIFIAGLGLFGLATFMATQRRKEIGIRKVLGATVVGITGLLAKDFLKLVAIAIVIASPVAYYFMQKWLADFAYSIDIQWWMFAAAGAAAIGIAFLTVSFQSMRAAMANPVQSLRSE